MSIVEGGNLNARGDCTDSASVRSSRNFGDPKWHISLTTSLIQVLENAISEWLLSPERAICPPKGVYEKGADATGFRDKKNGRGSANMRYRNSPSLGSGHAINCSSATNGVGQYNAKEQIAGYEEISGSLQKH